MKQNYYLICLALLITSCNSTGIKRTSNRDVNMSTENVDISRISKKQEQPVLQKIVLNSDPIKRDTTVGDYHISYTIQDSDEIITTYPVIDGKGLDTVYYAGREVILDINSDKGESLHKKIDRPLFSPYIPDEEIYKYSILYFELEEFENNEFTFDISLCIPETDILYSFLLYINMQDETIINDITPNDDEVDF